MGSDSGNLLSFLCGWLIANNASGKAQRSYDQGRYDEARFNNRRYYGYASNYRPHQSAKAGHEPDRGAHGATHQPAPMPLLRMSRD